MYEIIIKNYIAKVKIITCHYIRRKKKLNTGKNTVRNR